MDFWNFATLREAGKRAGMTMAPEDFYRVVLAQARLSQSRQAYAQIQAEGEWERLKMPYYNVWPGIVPMLLRLNLDVDASLIHLPQPCLCARFAKRNNSLTFRWNGDEMQIRSMLMSESKLDRDRLMSIQIDIGEVAAGWGNGGVPVYTYRNFRLKEGVTVEESLNEPGIDEFGEIGVQIPPPLITDCVRLCCTLCLLDNDPEIIAPDVLNKDRVKWDETRDQKYVRKAQRRGKVGWAVGRHIEVVPHYRRPHLMLAWTGPGRSRPRVVPRRGSVVHRKTVERIPTGFAGI